MNAAEKMESARPAAGRAPASRPGITLVEIMVAMVIMTIGVLGMIGAFKFFNVGVQSAKTRSLANNIAQERIEYLKNKSYYRILVSTQTDPPDANFAPPMVYDHAPNGEETVNVGGINFKRRVLIRKVNTDADGDLQEVGWDQPDTGLKQITVYVVWYERGEWRKLELRNLRENPNRVNSDCTISGTVTSGGGALGGVVVRAQENPSYYGETDSNGNYSFSIVPGSYSLLATKDYYFSSVRPAFSLAAGADATGKDFSLTAMNTGAIYGYAYLYNSDHLLVSNIVGSTETDTGETEWVEVYNPTTWTWTMANGLGTGNERVVFRYKAAGAVEHSLSFDYRTAALDPGHYFLFANTGTVSAAGQTRAADAVWSWNGTWLDQDKTMQTDPPAAGFVMLRDLAANRTLDTVGWINYTYYNPFDFSQFYPDYSAYESAPVWYYPSPYPYLYGLGVNMALTRNSQAYALNPGEASCYDSNQNYADFHVSSSPLAYGPRNTTDVKACTAGVPAQGAIVFADDGLSSPVVADNSGFYWLNPVSTGSWTVYMSSGVVYSSVAYYGGLSNGYASWTGYNWLSSPTAYGYVTGRVTNVLGAALSNIRMFSPGSSPVYTDWNGRYTLPVEAGVVNVMANYQSYSPSYVELSSAGITVGVGEVKQGVNFSLYQGGRIRGRVTTNGVDPLPNIPVVGLKGGVEQGSGISGSDGYFMISGTGISTGTYVVVPQLEAGESASPSSTTVTVQAGLTAFSSTYTVSGAFGYVTGSVTKDGAPITTGVMVYVTTAAIPAGSGPPDITPALRGGTVVYYAASSSALGAYNIPVKGGYSYNIYAWYTSWSGGSQPAPTTVRQSATGVAVGQNATVTRNLAW